VEGANLDSIREEKREEREVLWYILKAFVLRVFNPL